MILLSFAVCVQFFCCAIFFVSLIWGLILFSFVVCNPLFFAVCVLLSFAVCVWFFGGVHALIVGVHSIFHWQCWFDFIRSIFDLVCSNIFCYFVFFLFCKVVPNGPPYKWTEDCDLKENVRNVSLYLCMIQSFLRAAVSSRVQFTIKRRVFELN